MWIIFGILSVVFTLINMFFIVKRKKNIFVSFLGVSFVALMVAAFYGDAAKWVEGKDYGALSDVLPTVSVYIWICVILVIGVNGIPLVIGKDKKDNIL